jgi:TetR/AcrR family transcriptional regulator, repressor for neighboring sulfatase
VIAVLAAAAELFAKKGPAATSIRDIAVRSGVNHGLVYRHFGTKEELVAAVLDHLSDEVAAMADTGAGSNGLDAVVERHWRVIARAILDGYPVGRLQRRFPYVSRLVERAEPHHPDDLAARLAAGNAVALELGWRLFEPFVRSATGTRDVPPPRLRQAINNAVTEIVEPDRRG